MKKIYLFLTLALVLLFLDQNKAYSQNSLKVMVLDSASKTPVEFATMSIKYIGETQAKRYALTDSTGVAIIKTAPVGRASVLIECVGYRQHTQVFDVHKGANDMGTVYLNGQNTLKGIVVTAAGNQIVVKKDNIEYNASSFKTNETDMLEELLKKLPGVEIDSDGKITQNGKEITKIMIDGKVFFMDDPQLASKNLPAKIIEKVRVVERKSDEARFTGIDDGEEETVLDLSLKRGMADGWIGHVGGGYGTEKRYEGSFLVGRFTPKIQLSFIGNANNTNNRGFNDMAGSMMSVMMSGGGGNMMGGGGGGRGGFSWTGNGITASKMLGSNLNYQSPNKKLKVNTSYLFSTSNKDVLETKDRTTILSETLNQNNWSDGKQNTSTQGHRFDSEIEYNPTDATSFIFRPYLRVGSGDFDQRNNFYTLRGADSTNRGFNSSFGDNNSLQVGGRLMWRQRLWKPGRTLTFRVNYAFSNNSSDGFNISETNYFNEGIIGRIDGINQNYHQNQRSNQFGLAGTYTEPLGKNYFIQGSYRYSLNHSNAVKETYDYDPVTDTYSIHNDEYSSRYTSNFQNQRAEIALRKQEEKYNFMFGFSASPSKTTTIGRGRDTSYSVTNFSPSARLDYRISQDRFLRLYYWGRTNQPNLNQLLPIPDNSNPLYVQEGNDKLNPSFSHRIGGEYRTNNRKNFSFLGFNFETSYTTKSIINQKRYDEDGVQHSKYINADKGIYNFSGGIFYNSKIAKSDFTVNVFSRFSYGNGISYVATAGDFAENETKNLNVMLNLSLTYRIDNFEARIGGGTNFRNAWYSVKSLDDVQTWNNRVTASVNWTFLKTFNITTDITRRFYNGYSSGYGQSQTIWNGEVSKTFFRNAFTFKVRVYDILNKSKNTYRNTSENYFEDVTNNTLGRYLMFTLTYRFGSFGGVSMRDARRGGGPGRWGPPGGGGGRRR